MLKRISFLFLCSVAWLYSEPSAFELQSGATKKDITSLQSNSKNLQSVTADLQSRLTALEQVQEGFKSIIEGQNLKIKNFTDSFFSLQKSFDELKAENKNFDSRLKDSYKKMDELKKQLVAHHEDIKRLQASIQELNRVMTESNNNIIQQLTLMSQFLERTQKQQALSEEAERLQAQKLQNEKKQEKQEEKKSGKNQASKPGKTNKETFASIKDHLAKKNYDTAEALLNDLIKSEYKVAECYFMLANISYRKKDYVQAIGYYKKSATLDEQADYMPILLWRTAWSFKYIKDEENYKKFTDLLVRLYPDSEQAKRILNDRKMANKNQNSSQSGARNEVKEQPMQKGNE